MNEVATVFFLGPFYLLIQVIKLVIGGQMELGMFIVSGFGTAFWVGVVEAIFG
ncbi:hypothetical protein [Halobaculum rubrum]|uniref:hypothetical protein n=1 Tax=Halobaculum rubrum TaxID=2872158 RepID=UPI001CA38A35|nr:hypothetical protein [Halobaculum rubrum]QZX99386.1 hypothetical protein K6T25_14220 [Halobaculum rubrum]